jgi:dipeptidase
MDLLRLALERASSADDAVGVMVELLERHGQGGACSHERPGFTYHSSFLVADPSGAIVLETAGREWATEQVGGPGRSISNGLTIPAFAAAHADRLRGRVAACDLRRARTEAAAASASGPSNLMAALRDHGAGRPVPVWSRVNGSLEGPCAHAGGWVTSTQTTSSWVADLRDRPLHWATATSAPCTSVFKPIRVDEPLGLPTDVMNRYDEASLWWRHERLHRVTLRDHGGLLARYRHARDRAEATWLTDPPSSADAFDAADDLEADWLADVAGAGVPDRRPRWLRRMWDGFDAAAGMPDPAPVPVVS